MKRALEGVRVMVTRAPDQSEDLSRMLSARGAQVDAVSLISFGPPPSERALQQAVENLDNVSWLVFSSANGVGAFAKRRGSTTLPADLKVAAIGPATAAAVSQSFHIAPALQPEKFVSEELAQAVIARAEPRSKVLLIQAADARPVLAQRLLEAGLEVQAVAAYTTLESPPDNLWFHVKDADAITLASASTVRSLVKGLAGENAPLKLRGKLLACIGPVTEQEARRLGLHVEVTSATSTLEGLVDALCSYYAGSDNLA